jgi:hypothetical protein
MVKDKTMQLAVTRQALFVLLILALKATDARAARPIPARPTKRTPATLTRDTPLSEAIDILRNATTPPLNIAVYWKDLEANANVSRATAIGFDSVPGLRLRQYLEILLNSVSATSLAPIGYTVDRGVVVIATKDSLPKPQQTTRVYDVTDLVAPPSRPTLFDVPTFGVMMYGGIPRRFLGNLGPYDTPRGRPRSRRARPVFTRRR